MKNYGYIPCQISILGCGLVAILFGGIAIASLALSGPKMPELAARSVAAIGGKADRCEECGVIQSTTDSTASDAATGVNSAKPGFTGNSDKREQTATRRREIVIRMQDGSTMVIAEPNLGNWKVGERVKVLAGVD